MVVVNTSAPPPHFVCIGAPKAGTTWLYANLRRHPQIWLPPIKEIHFWDRPRTPYLLDMIHPSPRRRFLFRRWLRPAFAAALRRPRELGWLTRFFLLPRSETWYRALFTPAPAQIAGDITPGYAPLDRCQVEQIFDHAPDARVIYLMRHPVDRMWSHAAMFFERYGNSGLARASEKQVEWFLEWSVAHAYSDYLSTLRVWESVYADRRLFYGFFEELEKDPSDLFRRICRFLGVDDSPARVPPSVTGRVHARHYPPIPPHLARRLARRYHPMLQSLHAHLKSPYTLAWLERNEAYAAA